MIIRLLAGAGIIAAVLYSSAEADTSTDIVVESATCQCSDCLTEGDVRSIVRNEMAKATPKTPAKPAASSVTTGPNVGDKAIVQIGDKWYQGVRGASGSVCIGGRCYPRGSFVEMVK